MQRILLRLARGPSPLSVWAARRPSLAGVLAAAGVGAAAATGWAGGAPLWAVGVIGVAALVTGAVLAVSARGLARAMGWLDRARFDVWRAELDLADASARGDLSRIRRLLDEGFLLHDGVRTVGDAEAWLRTVLATAFVDGTFERLDVRIDLSRATVAATYRQREWDERADRETLLRLTDVWTPWPDGWRLRSRELVPVRVEERRAA